ncbi:MULTISPECIES: TetR/AcrR family transcriptional regulator [Sphingobium]|uniref:TetR/AcrR family transcriptional regulator n=1 Tax=Sphingobium TaxID=165695 RepID=UPI00159C79E3|nr:TetR/AcrR family transcriptional regulator [Sphingobium sp. 15-1]
MSQTPPSSKKTKKPKETAANATIPRAPQRVQGRLRFELLVDTTDRLISERGAGDLSLYDIAEAAGVPAASVYHFFPSMAAAVVAVAQRYLQIFEEIIASDLDHAELVNWRDIFRIIGERARQFYNGHEVVRRLFLGSEYSWQVRMADIQGNESYARILARTYERHFHIADPDFLCPKIEIAIGLSDSVWSLSCLRHNIITDDYAVEAERAYHSYLTRYIAELAPKRTAPMVSLPSERAAAGNA